jgi:ATP-binding cassette subfamily B protein
VEIMEVKSDITDAPDAIELKDVRGDIEFENVSFSYDGNEKVLENINITIPAGQSIALVGLPEEAKQPFAISFPGFMR